MWRQENNEGQRVSVTCNHQVAYSCHLESLSKSALYTSHRWLFFFLFDFFSSPYSFALCRWSIPCEVHFIRCPLERSPLGSETEWSASCTRLCTNLVYKCQSSIFRYFYANAPENVCGRAPLFLSFQLSSCERGLLQRSKEPLLEIHVTCCSITYAQYSDPSRQPKPSKCT